MDYEGLRQFANSQEGVYTAIAVGSVVFGYVVGKVRGGKKVRIAEAERDKEKFALERDKLKYAGADGEHQRKLALMEKEREYKLQDEQRQSKREIELASARAQQEQAKHQRRMQLAEKLVGLQPVLEEYLKQAASAPKEDEAYLNQRREFTKELVDKTLEYIDNTSYDDYVGQRIVQGINIIDEDGLEVIRKTVDAAYPLEKRGEIPAEISGLIKLVIGEE